MQAKVRHSAHYGYRYKALCLSSLAAALLLVACASPPGMNTHTVQPPDAVTQAGHPERQTNEPRGQTDEGQERLVDFGLFEISENLRFNSQSWELDAATRRHLDKLATSLARFQDHSVIIVGHSDHAGDTNLELPERRAGAVRSYLVHQGISPDRLYIAASDPPPLANSSASGNQDNPRVEIIVSESRMTVR